MLTGPLEPFPRPFPRTPYVETRATMPVDLLPREGLMAKTVLDGAILVEIATRFPPDVTGECPACSEATTGVVSVGVQLMAANYTSSHRGPMQVVLEGSRPRSYRMEPCGCVLEVR